MSPKKASLELGLAVTSNPASCHWVLSMLPSTSAAPGRKRIRGGEVDDRPLSLPRPDTVGASAPTVDLHDVVDLLKVALIAPEGRHVVRVDRTEEAVEGFVLGGQTKDALCDCGSVGGVGERLTDSLVVQGRLGGIEHQDFEVVAWGDAEVGVGEGSQIGARRSPDGAR